MIMPLDVTAQLSLSDKNGKEISVCAQNGVISIVLPSLWTEYPFKQPFVERRQRENLLRVLHQGLQDIDLNIELRVAHRIIALIGPKTQAGFISKILGFGPVKLRVTSIMLSLFRK